MAPIGASVDNLFVCNSHGTVQAMHQCIHIPHGRGKPVNGGLPVHCLAEVTHKVAKAGTCSHHAITSSASSKAPFSSKEMEHVLDVLALSHWRGTIHQT
jgi:hypothetical protein